MPKSKMLTNPQQCSTSKANLSTNNTLFRIKLELKFGIRKLVNWNIIAVGFNPSVFKSTQWTRNK